MSNILQSPLFGMALSILCYAFGTYVNKKCKGHPLANALLIAVALIIVCISAFDIPLAAFQKGSSVIGLFLAPATAALGLTIYRQRTVLKQYFVPVLAGCLVGSLASLLCVYLLCNAFHMGDVITASMLPKSVTTAIATQISEANGGIPAITVAAVISTGITGGVFAPVFVKLFHVKNPVAAGIGIGTCSHAIGTAKALQLGEIQGAMGSVALSVSGLLTSVLILLF